MFGVPGLSAAGRPRSDGLRCTADDGGRMRVHAGKIRRKGTKKGNRENGKNRKKCQERDFFLFSGRKKRHFRGFRVKFRSFCYDALEFPLRRCGVLK